MNDPFMTLGIPSSSSEDEIKAAYRKLAKQYHPDLHPGDKQAEDKMKEINEAYAEAIRVKKQGSYNPDMYGANSQWNSNANPYSNAQWGGAWGNPWGPFGTAWGSDSGWNPFGSSTQTGTYQDSRLQAASDYIQTGRYQEALNILQGMQEETAQWHYLNALAHRGMMNQIAALSHARQAVQMAPDNLIYRQLLNELQGPSRQYTAQGGNPFGGSMCSSSSLFGCLALNFLLNCCCRRSGWFLCC